MSSNLALTFKTDGGYCIHEPLYGIAAALLAVAVVAGLAAWRFRRKKKPQRFKLAAALAVIASVPCVFIAIDILSSAGREHFERWHDFQVPCGF